MPDPIVPAVTRQKVEAEGHSRKGTVTGKGRVALDAMIWGGIRKEAAEQAGLADASIRFAMRKVASWPTRTANWQPCAPRSAPSVHRFARIADDSKNDMARVSAPKGARDDFRRSRRHHAARDAAGRPRPRVLHQRRQWKSAKDHRPISISTDRRRKCPPRSIAGLTLGNRHGALDSLKRSGRYPQTSQIGRPSPTGFSESWRGLTSRRQKYRSDRKSG
jgi:hypothetical protein